MNMQHLFLPYPLALKAKELGFDEPCIAYYLSHGNRKLMPIKNNGIQWKYVISTEVGMSLVELAAPLYQQIIDWLEREHGIGVEIALDITLSWVWRLTPLHPEASIHTRIVPEYVNMVRIEALEAAITEAFKLVNETRA